MLSNLMSWWQYIPCCADLFYFNILIKSLIGCQRRYACFLIWLQAYFLIWPQRFQLAINCIFLTITLVPGLLRNVSQYDSLPFTTPVNYYYSLACHHFLHTVITVSQLCVLKLKTNCWSVGDKSLVLKEDTNMLSLFVTLNSFTHTLLQL